MQGDTDGLAWWEEFKYQFSGLSEVMTEELTVSYSVVVLNHLDVEQIS